MFDINYACPTLFRTFFIELIPLSSISFLFLSLDFSSYETTSVNHCITDSLASGEENKPNKETTFIQNKKGGIVSCQDILIN
jgi:hypothetical protein